MAPVFLSYRHHDAEASANRIAEHLANAFDRSAVFQDVYSMPPGRDFRSSIEEALKDSETVLIIIGPRWLTAMDRPGRRRIDNDDDFVRQEIEFALGDEKLVIPVLVDGATMPSASELPESIRGLAYRNAMHVRSGTDFSADMQRLIAALEENTTALRARPRLEQPPPPMAAPHQIAAMPLHILIVAIFGVLALAAIGGGIYAITVHSAAKTTLTILGAELRTEHVGVAFVGIGFIIAFLTVRSVLKSQHDLAKLPLDR